MVELAAPKVAVGTSGPGPRQLAHRLLSDVKGKKILDVASGGGYFADDVSPCAYASTDAVRPAGVNDVFGLIIIQLGHKATGRQALLTASRTIL